MRVTFRADASVRIGAGHVMRCLALADELRERGAETHFICRELPGHLGELIRGKGHPLSLLPPPPEGYLPPDAVPAHAAWLGLPWETDAAETGARLPEDTDWLVVDHYALDARWESALAARVGRILVIDDLADRRHACDILLDQNLGPARRYDGLLGADTRLLLGPRHALLRSEFRLERQAASARDGSVRRWLLFFGGSDPDNLTGAILSAISETELASLPLDVVVGAQNSHWPELQAACADLPNVRLHRQTDAMAALFREADLALGAGGTATWERACMGLPTVILSFADNQIDIAGQAARARLAINLGRFARSTLAQLMPLLARLCRRPGLLRRMSRRASATVDGHGTARVAAALGMSPSVQVVSDEQSWINGYLAPWIADLHRRGHGVRHVHHPDELQAGDIAFLLGCGSLARPSALSRNAHNLVVHESDLPRGRGWSPLTWQVLEGASKIPVTLFEASEQVDAGAIYLSDTISLSGMELVDELRALQAQATLKLCDKFLSGYPFLLAQAGPQRGKATFYERRHPEDSRLDPDRTLREQFNLLRVVDNERYPAYFEINGRRYLLKIEPS